MLSRVRRTILRQVPDRHPATRERSYQLLRQAFGPDAEFRPGQLDAIGAIVEDRARLLVIQHTGWGKSLVYFLSTLLLREQGSGPTLLVSPLLSLMRNQLTLAEHYGVRAASLTSENREEWDEITTRLASDAIDLLMISPERLANLDFRTVQLPRLQAGIGHVVAVQELAAWRARAPHGDTRLAAHTRLALLSILQIANAKSALPLENDARDLRVGFKPKVRPLQSGLQEPARRRPAPPRRSRSTRSNGW